MKEKLEKLKKLADAMYYAAQYLTTDASRLHKAMDDYHQFIIHEYKEESVSEDLEEAAIEYCGGNKGSDARVRTGFIMGAKWQKEHLMTDAIEGEVGYWNLHGLSVNVELPHSIEEGDKVKVIVIKEG